MFNGGVAINRRTSQIIRFVGLIVPVVLTIYGLLIPYGLVDSSRYSGDTVLFLIVIPWLAIGAIQFLYPAKTRTGSGCWLVTYHILAALYILFVAGFTMPFVAAWVLLFIGSYAYFSTIGIWLSVITLIVTATVDVAGHLSNTITVINDAITAIAILIVGLAAVAISRVQEIDGAELSRSKALESLQRDRILTLVNNLADAILSTNAKGIINVYNAASLNLLDTNTGLNGRHIDEILTLVDSDKKPVNVFKDMKESHNTTIRDDLTTTIGGETLRLEITYSPIRSSYSRIKKGEAQDGYILILRDVTKAKSLEEERDEFISVVSHELRTPIAIAEGTISNVQLMMSRPDIAESLLKDGIDTAHEQVIFLAKMVNDLSTLSRAERGVADTPELIDIRSLVDDLYKEYAPQAEAKKLHFNLDVGARLGHITTSRLYLQELLQNFITNSIKYTKEGSVTLHVAKKDGSITFEVKDTGIGISKSDQAKVFNKFYRSEDYRTRETGGTGLGLYVAMKLSKKLSTKIELQSRLNKGSAIIFKSWFSIQLYT
jgi:two-component system phosphate regulon sensor histidine kinase PhoR